MSRLFCAECLPPSLTTANYGCCFGVHGYWPNATAVFFSYIARARLIREFFMKEGFTLIELLVVVLIIGILAAIAVPQYQFAIDKARVAPYVQHVQTAVRSEQVIYMAEGAYTNQFDVLDTGLTKMCKTLNGTCRNQLETCQGGFAFHVPSTGCNAFPFAVIELKYCQNMNSCTIGSSTDAHLYATFSMATGKATSCVHRTSRGKKLCAYINESFK